MPKGYFNVYLLNSCLAFFSFLVLSAYSARGLASTVCTMTFNSSDEKNEMRNLYQKNGVRFVELVPADRQDDWLDNACRSGVQCDVLLVSGHFGGVFFGESSGLSLSLPEIEQASCRRECEGIFKRPKDVMLYGCNTLAGKKRDHRTFEQYVQVLVRDGFDRELAENVALTRYADLGLTMAERFATAFAETPRIHGYHSTGPLGKHVAPHLRKALQSTTADSLFSQGMPVQRLLKSLGASSYTVVAGDNHKNESRLKRQLLCSSASLSNEAFTFIFSEVQFRKHYENLLRNSSSAQFVAKLKAWLRESPGREDLVRGAFEGLLRRPEMTWGTRLKIVDLFESLELLSSLGARMTRSSTARQAIQNLSLDGFTYQEAEQICSLRSHFKNIRIEPHWFVPSAEKSPYIESIRECLGLNQNSSEGVPPALPGNMEFCLRDAAFRETPQARDGARWSCFNRYEAFIQNTDQCQQAAARFETDSRRGLDWSCIKQFPQDLTVKQCLNAARRNSSPSNADDMLWGCWSRLRDRGSLTRSQCLTLSVNMKIHGNRLKMNWNCQNRL